MFWSREPRLIAFPLNLSRFALPTAASLTVLPLFLSRYLPFCDLPEHLAVISTIQHWWDPAWHAQEYFTLQDPASTPYLLYLVRDGNTWRLADQRVGYSSAAEMVNRVQELLDGVRTPGLFGERPASPVFNPPLGLTPLQQTAAVREFLGRVAGGPVLVEQIGLEDQEMRVYRALDTRGTPTGLFARIVSRNPACDVCHSVHFLLAFRSDGTVRGFQPIYVAKDGNVEWNEDEAARMASSLKGRRLAGLDFDPRADAVTGATISSSVIFDAARRTAELLPALPAVPDAKL